MKVTMLTQVNERARDGRVFSAGEGTVREVDDADTDMIALLRTMVAHGRVDIDGEKTEETEEPDTGPDEIAVEIESVEVSPTRYEDKTVLELRELARSRGLPMAGSKDELITRLRGTSEGD